MFDKNTGIRERMHMLFVMSQNDGDSFTKMSSTEVSSLVPTLRRDSNQVHRDNKLLSMPDQRTARHHVEENPDVEATGQLTSQRIVNIELKSNQR